MDLEVVVVVVVVAVRNSILDHLQEAPGWDGSNIFPRDVGSC